jgi:mercuric ion transport protein
MPQVDFVYDPACPNVALARTNLVRAFSATGLAARWHEHRIGDPNTVVRVRGFGSPTVLVDGRDVARSEPGPESCCRIYGEGRAATGAPSVELIAAALRETAPAAPGRETKRWRLSFAAIPAVAVALVPKVVCPLCWPAYGAVLTATGFAFLMEDRWLLPISLAMLAAAVAAMAWRAKARRGYGPATAGLSAAALVVAGRFALSSSLLTYAGVAALIAAALWNVWPRREAPTCGACTSSTATETSNGEAT